MKRFTISVGAAQQLLGLDPKAPVLDVEVGTLERHVGLGHASSTEIRIEGSLAWLQTHHGKNLFWAPMSLSDAQQLLARASNRRLIRRTLLEVGEGLLLEHEINGTSVEVVSRCPTSELIALAATAE